MTILTSNISKATDISKQLSTRKKAVPYIFAINRVPLKKNKIT
jgi:hypothetical protein